MRKSPKKVKTRLLLVVVVKLGMEEKTVARKRLQEVMKGGERRMRGRNRAKQSEEQKTSLNVKNKRLKLFDSDSQLYIFPPLQHSKGENDNTKNWCYEDFSHTWFL